jgi:glycine cleavage system protein P-like pyridoxal-binding family
MIEPTESESLEELDLFIEAMRSIAREVEETPELVKTAPHSTRVSRLDEVQAARKADSALAAGVQARGAFGVLAVRGPISVDRGA